jgi:DNA polymerase III subunit delta
MVALRGAQVGAFLAKPDPRLRTILLFGPDAGLVSERGQRLAAVLAGREQPPGDILRMDDDDLESGPDRLTIELMTVPMFGGARIVRASAGRRINAAVRSLLDANDPIAGALIVEAGELRPDEGLRGPFERSPIAVAIPCYPDEGASLDGIVDEALAAAAMAIAPDARLELTARLGADRALSRAELDKLVLYAHGAPRIEMSHVEAIVGDASVIALDRVVAAAATGDFAAALSSCDRAVASGESAQSIMLAAERHFQRLHRLRAGIDAGRTLDEQLRQLRPPPPPRARAELERQARSWTTARVAMALLRIGDAIKASRTTGGAEEALIAERLLMEIARLAAAGNVGRRPSS